MPPAPPCAHHAPGHATMDGSTLCSAHFSVGPGFSQQQHAHLRLVLATAAQSPGPIVPATNQQSSAASDFAASGVPVLPAPHGNQYTLALYEAAPALSPPSLPSRLAWTRYHAGKAQSMQQQLLPGPYAHAAARPRHSVEPASSREPVSPQRRGQHKRSSPSARDGASSRSVADSCPGG